MSEQNDNWRAKCESATVILVRPNGVGIYSNSLMPHEAIELRDQLTAALEEVKRLEEAKRLEDPFEKWWAGLPRSYNDFRYVAKGVMVLRDEGRMIFDTVRKAAP